MGMLTVEKQEMKVGGVETLLSAVNLRVMRKLLCFYLKVNIHVRLNHVWIQRKLSDELPQVLTDLFLALSEENAERIMLDPTSRENLKFKDLLKVVCDHMWKYIFSSAGPETAEWELVIVLC